MDRFWFRNDPPAWCDRHLAGCGKPRHIEFRTGQPKSNVGRILRRSLRDEATTMKAA